MMSVFYTRKIAVKLTSTNVRMLTFVGSAILLINLSLAEDVAGLSLAKIKTLESQLAMPKGAFPIDTYVRYYSLEKNVSSRIKGKYVHDPRSAGIRLVEFNDVPSVKDGGCSVVTLEFDIDTNRVVTIYCNQDS